MAKRRFDKYPQLSRLVQAMSPEGRELVAHWHRVLTTALEGYLPHVSGEAADLYPTGLSIRAGELRRAASQGAVAAVQGWLRTMREVAGIISDPSSADWCCAPGMLADPEPCPQHGFHPDREYEPGTIIERDYVDGKEKAVCVPRGEDEALYWRSLRFPMEYDARELAAGRWKVVGRA
jgi:hypothetical protein